MKWHTQGDDGLNGWQTHRGNETEKSRQFKKATEQ